VEQIHLEERRQKKVLMKYSKLTGCVGSQIPQLDEAVLKRSREDKEKDNVRLSVKILNMEFAESQRKELIDKWDLSLNASCSNIEVAFLGATHGKYSL
jgi:hypothetical protein